MVCRWDLASHTLPLTIVDPDFAKQQLQLMPRGLYLHPLARFPLTMGLQRCEPAGACLGNAE